jgi:hypothetical protein
MKELKSTQIQCLVRVLKKVNEMKIKRVNQYQCEYCGKKNYSAGHMKSHELHCTLNPNRKCKMCDKLVDWAGLEDQRPVPMDKLLEVLPKPKEVTRKEYWEDPFGPGYRKYETIENIDEINAAIEKLKEITEGCPACILAALRQKGIMVPTTDFDYGAECREFWSEW